MGTDGAATVAVTGAPMSARTEFASGSGAGSEDCAFNTPVVANTNPSAVTPSLFMPNLRAADNERLTVYSFMEN
jgi:hypothetical protein